MSLLGEQVGGNPLVGGMALAWELFGSDADTDIDTGMGIGFGIGVGMGMGIGTVMVAVGRRQGLSRRPLAVRTADTGM